MVKRLISRIIAAALGWTAMQSVATEMLPDPTRPPLSAGFVVNGSNPAVDAGPVLQSIKIAPGHRSAVISGQLLAQGEFFGTAKLVSISESEVVLLGPEGQQTLKLFPSVEKYMAQPPQGQPVARGKYQSKRKTEQKAP